MGELDAKILDGSKGGTVKKEFGLGAHTGVLGERTSVSGPGLVKVAVRSVLMFFIV